MTSSKKANAYGTAAERKAAAEYRLTIEGVHNYWRDAVMQDGTPVEIKAAMVQRADGTPGRFRIFENAHDQLAARDGRYVFVAYRVRGRGIQVLRSKMIHASRLPGSTWYGAGGHRDSRQRKLRIDSVWK